MGPKHLTPAEMWIQSGLPEDTHFADQLRILSIIFPYVNRIREESKTAKEMPAEILEKAASNVDYLRNYDVYFPSFNGICRTNYADF